MNVRRMVAVAALTLGVRLLDGQVSPITVGLPVGALAWLGLGRIRSLAYSPDGRRLAVSTSIVVELRGVKSLKVPVVLAGHNGMGQVACPFQVPEASRRRSQHGEDPDLGPGNRRGGRGPSRHLGPAQRPDLRSSEEDPRLGGRTRPSGCGSLIPRLDGSSGRPPPGRGRRRSSSPSACE